MITDRQKDALAEVINIGFARAASALSDLTDQRVYLDPPDVNVYPIDELCAALECLAEGEVATVHQIFAGAVAGDALLILDADGAGELYRLMTHEERKSGGLGASEREVLTEIGNILLNATLGTFGNLLRVHITFAVPRLHVDSLHGLLQSLIIESEELTYGLVVFTSFRLRDSAVRGYLVMVLGVSSLSQLIAELEQLG